MELIHKFLKKPAKKRLKKYKTPLNKIIILYFGRLHPEKDLGTLIRAMALVKEKNFNAHLIVAGMGHMDKELKKLAESLNIKNDVSFWGRVPDEEKVAAFSVADIFVLPSLAELEGMVVLEAMACGKPIVIANSPRSSSAWLEYESQFKEEYNIISLDLRGHGKSSRLNGRRHYEIENFAEDINNLLEHLSVENFILVSHSFGTLVALEFLAKYQEKVASAIFLSPNFSIGKTKSEKVIKPLINILSWMAALFPSWRKKGRHIDYSKYKNTGDWNLRRMFADIRNTGIKTFLSCTRNSYKFDREEFLNQIKIPALLIHGKNDTIFSAANSVKMAEKIEKAELILLDNANHIIVFNNFAEVSRAIKNFAEKTNNTN